jgi:hypothetical protein
MDAPERWRGNASWPLRFAYFDNLNGSTAPIDATNHVVVASQVVELKDTGSGQPGSFLTTCMPQKST